MVAVLSRKFVCVLLESGCHQLRDDLVEIPREGADEYLQNKTRIENCPLAGNSQVNYTTILTSFAIMLLLALPAL